MTYYIVIIVAAFLGLLVSLTIIFEKKNEAPMACPLGLQCEDVLRSRYSNIFGLPNEYGGIFYYGLIFVSYLLTALSAVQLGITAEWILLILTAGAFIFSIILTWIQAFVLKAWCSWCIASGILSTIIFILVLLSTSVDYLSIFS